MTDTLTETEMTKVQDILIHQLQIKREQITPEARIMADLGRTRWTWWRLR